MMLLSTIERPALLRLLAGYGLDLRLVAPATPIPGSYWGEREAGLQGNVLFARLDTPLHSILHEAAPSVSMPPEPRVVLARNAGGDDGEEGGVCSMQKLLANALAGMARQ